MIIIITMSFSTSSWNGVLSSPFQCIILLSKLIIIVMKIIKTTQDKDIHTMMGIVFVTAGAIMNKEKTPVQADDYYHHFDHDDDDI